MSLKKRWRKSRDEFNLACREFASKDFTSLWNKYFPEATDKSGPKFIQENIMVYPHPEELQHKKCCDGCVCVRESKDYVKSMKNYPFFCVHQLKDGKHKICAGWWALVGHRLGVTIVKRMVEKRIRSI